LKLEEFNASNSRQELGKREIAEILFTLSTMFLQMKEPLIKTL